ncbi:prepilin-type N-terminal cleavage/methylation domain-containing protein [Pseudoalteromonas sp. CO348]|uniref:type IV pilin protein n=1 Tax=Pseudoalteromonas TaxID=53246 RepID=UPI001023BBB2|nr:MULTISPECIES: type IV pilin protein [Pseudoalteromonas]MCG7542488.1 type IV pilin protein [Pseudoalteromonas sp. OF7H-1]MCG9769026.1 type IV pilin protein [Pseudoalteromonas piscicida]RZG07628.1 prepilin-type N-terminal cleavage/methylation domain-containing protein [Pseudoalteromonas sp. CO348]
MRRNSTLDKAISGFTLIEVMIVVVIIGILSAIAYPNYTEYVRRGARADAMTLLLDAANKQEQFFVDNRAYSDNLAAIGVATATENGYFNVTLENVTADTFRIVATAAAGPVQGDEQCPALTIDELGVRGVTGTTDQDAIDRCWER